MSRTPRIAVTLGDPAGIGPEITARALGSMGADASFVVYGNRAVWDRAGGSDCDFVATDDESLDAYPFGRGSRASGRSAFRALERATDDLVAGRVDGLCTAPLAKSAVQLELPSFVGHTEYLAARFSVPVVMLMAGKALRVALVTTHVAVADLPRLVTREAIVRTLDITARELRERFGLANPRLAVCGLNPHAGEHGAFGDEELRIIAPALDDARAMGLHVEGPFPADGLFPRASEQGYAAVVAMFHDQGLIPFKLAEFHDGVNVTAGLPRPRTSPDHGTAWDKAGQGVADARSMRSALELCVRLAGG